MTDNSSSPPDPPPATDQPPENSAWHDNTLKAAIAAEVESARQSQRRLGTLCIIVGILCLLAGGACVVGLLPGFALGGPLIWGGVLLLQGQSAPWAKPLLIVASVVLGLLVLAILLMFGSLSGMRLN